ncbi:hypothetical protein KFY46_26670, partial [Salmonella enterica subsp. enterica serovar 1,4,[5],12:i:-]|nr:hypothetical protein [Salmonella enterica subsp. enterica serovar 1,4,[5],12:i:-]
KKAKRVFLYSTRRRKVKEKVYIIPSPMEGGLHNPPTYERSISPPELLKTDQITPKAVLKNHSKS